MHAEGLPWGLHVPRGAHVPHLLDVANTRCTSGSCRGREACSRNALGLRGVNVEEAPYEAHGSTLSHASSSPTSLTSHPSPPPATSHLHFSTSTSMPLSSPLPAWLLVATPTQQHMAPRTCYISLPPLCAITANAPSGITSTFGGSPAHPLWAHSGLQLECRRRDAATAAAGVGDEEPPQRGVGGCASVTRACARSVYMCTISVSVEHENIKIYRNSDEAENRVESNTNLE
jgi:hypothetical protein